MAPSPTSDDLDGPRERRRHTRQILARMRDDQLALLARFRGRETRVQSLLYRLGDLGHERRVPLGLTLHALGWQQTEAQRILGLSMETRGQLRATVMGVSEPEIDRAPAGEWSVRQLIEHMINIEQRYRLQILDALEIARGVHAPDPAALEAGLPANFDGETRTTGPVNVPMAESYEERQRTIAAFIDMTTQELDTPSQYARMEVDLRYRLGRFAGHERAHVIQIRKTLLLIGHHPTETERVIAQAELARGLIEAQLIGIPQELAERSPGPGLKSVESILRSGAAEEDELTDAIAAALEAEG